MRLTRLTAAVAVLAMVAAACGDGSSRESTPTEQATTTTRPPEAPATTLPFVNGEEIKLDVPRVTTEVADDDLATVARSDSQLGLDLLEVVAGDENVMLSPYSIATALSMLYAGARGQTAAEIARVLHLEVDDATLHAARNEIETHLAATPPPSSGDDTREPFTIRPANSAWGQGGYPFSEEYLEVLAGYYGAGLRLTDFAGDPGEATETINDWVEETTQDRIRDLIPQGVIDTFTRLVLVNAVWFKANWEGQFDPELTAPGDFTRLDGSKVTVPLMHGSQRGGYAETNAYQAIRLPYAGEAAMVVMLPKAGTPADLAAALDPDSMRPQWAEAQVDVTMPSFEFESEIPLKRALMDLGMVTAFAAPQGEAGADLTGITPIRELFVTDALHQSFIALDEHGTEAAAATALIVGLTAAGPPPAAFVADRPFLFWIEHSATGEILFLGQVTDPSRS